MRYFVLDRSKVKNKKFVVFEIDDKGDRIGRLIHFGDSRYDDYRIHRSKKRRDSYIARHGVMEDWSMSGVNSAGFWSRWLLWQEKTLSSSIKNLESMFPIKVYTKF